MPSAPRERKPALAALAVLLVALGAVAAGYLVINAGHRVGAVEITQQVGQGQRIPASAIKEVEIASNSGINYVAWQYANRVAGVYASVQIPAGTLLTPAMTTATNNLAAGKVQVGLSLKPGQAPANLLIGQSVEAFGVGTGSGCGAAAGGGGTGSGARRYRQRRGRYRRRKRRKRKRRRPRRAHHHRRYRQRGRLHRVQRFHRRGHPRGS